MTETSIKANRLWNVVQSSMSRLSSATIFVVSIYYLLLSVVGKVTSLHLEIILFIIAFHFLAPPEELTSKVLRSNCKYKKIQGVSGSYTVGLQLILVHVEGSFPFLAHQQRLHSTKKLSPRVHRNLGSSKSSMVTILSPSLLYFTE